VLDSITKSFLKSTFPESICDRYDIGVRGMCDGSDMLDTVLMVDELFSLAESFEDKGDRMFLPEELFTEING
jgi:hypothetical protein